MNTNFIHTYVSVDCVIFGINSNQLNILLVRRNSDSDEPKELKLPGSLIYNEEDVDDAASRILFELTGIKKLAMHQFRCFASPNRANNPKDIKWLDKAYSTKINRLITVAYLSLCNIDRKLNNISKYRSIEWCPLNQLPQMPFDHNQIVNQSLSEIRRWVELEPSIVFELLPNKFTAAELRGLYEAIYHKEYDVRNFHKKMLGMEYLIPLEEKQQNVSHRAARYYKFDKILYKKLRGN